MIGRIIWKIVTGLILIGVTSAATVFLVCVFKGIGQVSVYSLG